MKIIVWNKMPWR